MVAFIVKSAVCYYYVGTMRLSSFWFLSSLLLRTNHYQRKLTCWLPHLIFFRYLLSIQGYIFSSLMIPWFRTILSIINLIFGIVRTWIEMFFFFFLNNSSSSQDVKSSLCFCDQLSVLMLLKTNIFLLYVLLVCFIFVYWLWVHVVKSFCAQ